MDNDRDKLIKMPKVELHNHLEGSITPKLFHQLAKINSESAFSSSLSECEKLFSFNSFEGFLEAFSVVNRYIKSIDDVELIFNNFLNSIRNNNYFYVEFFLSIDTFLKKNFDLVEILDKLGSLIRKVSDVKLGLNIDFVRNYGPKNAELLLDELQPNIEDYRDFLLGISIGGNETKYPPKPYKKIFEKARLMGLKTTAHSGETEGPESIWDSILELKTDRIGHGINAIDSLDLIKHLRATQTPLEVCPTSNIVTGVVNGSINQHPIRKLYDQGVNITINTDDAGFFNTNLSKEFLICAETFNFSYDELKSIQFEGMKASFQNELIKKELLFELQNKFELI